MTVYPTYRDEAHSAAAKAFEEYDRAEKAGEDLTAPGFACLKANLVYRLETYWTLLVRDFGESSLFEPRVARWLVEEDNKSTCDMWPGLPEEVKWKMVEERQDWLEARRALVFG